MAIACGGIRTRTSRAPPAASPRGSSRTASARATRSAVGREPPRVDRLLLGHPARRRDRRPDRLPLVTGIRRPHPRIVGAEPWSSAGDDVDAGRRCRVWKLADLDWAADGPIPGGADRSRRHRADRVHVRRHRRAEGRGHPPSQHPRERRAGRAARSTNTRNTRGRSSRSGS